ncbi:uncharacterized protein LOC124413065 [Diprion similis]|uniref:uncharacterized protein LOC124413065 n=1 Tax=Diprion similis TaxID=362088 RepID=UPI001EF76FBD|nr:uncharacterized protein LOC124413065 [Diprion similis]
MKLDWVFFALLVPVTAGFDLGPSMRIAQCRSLCLRRHQEAEECKDTSNCYMCWEACGFLENDWTIWGSVCQDDEEICLSGCKTACAYHATRVEEEFLPSTLPAPMAGPAYLEAYDVAIVFRKVEEEWKEMDQIPGGGAMTVNETTWVVVVAENGVRQYSGEFWKPTLECLRAGALFEASLSWSGNTVEDNEIGDIDSPKSGMQAIDFENDEVLRNALSSTRTLRPRDSAATDRIRLYFTPGAKSYFDEQNARILADVGVQGEEERPEIYGEEPSLMETTSKNSVEKGTGGASYIVSWEPEAGGLMGNQVADAKSTQISLLPGTKYLVRIASNEGPGSFALEIDTTIKSVQFAPLEAVHAYIQPLAILAGCASALSLVAVAVLLKVCRRTPVDDKLDYV